MSYCYYRISKTVKDDVLSEGHIPSMLQAAATKRKRRVVKILVLMVVAFVISWLPLTIINFLQDIQVIPQQHILLHIASHLLATTSTVWNPLLYFWLSNSHLVELRNEINQQVAGFMMAASRIAMKQWSQISLPRHSMSLAKLDESEHTVLPHPEAHLLTVVEAAEEEMGDILSVTSRKSAKDPFSDAAADFILEKARRKLMNQRKSYAAETKHRFSVTKHHKVLRRSYSDI